MCEHNRIVNTHQELVQGGPGIEHMSPDVPQDRGQGMQGMEDMQA